MPPTKSRPNPERPIVCRELRKSDVEGLARAFGGPPFDSPPGRWPTLLDEHRSGQRVVLVARRGRRIAGYGTLLHKSGYPPFHNAGIPEIADVAVALDARRSGIATHIVHALEERARRDGCTAVGLGVGLDAGFGAAQRLYVKLGYAPDGCGVTSAYRPVGRGESIEIGDHTLLWLSKPLT